MLYMVGGDKDHIVKKIRKLSVDGNGETKKHLGGNLHKGSNKLETDEDLARFRI